MCDSQLTKQIECTIIYITVTSFVQYVVTTLHTVRVIHICICLFITNICTTGGIILYGTTYRSMPSIQIRAHGGKVCSSK